MMTCKKNFTEPSKKIVFIININSNKIRIIGKVGVFVKLWSPIIRLIVQE